MPGLDQFLEGIRLYIRDVGNAFVQAIHFSCVGVDPYDVEACLGEHHCQWQTDVAQPQNPNPGPLCF